MKKRGFYVCFPALLIGLLVSPLVGHVGGATVAESPSEKNARMQWWREARFGLFIHWGLYAIPAGTWQGREIPGIGEWIMLRGKIPVAAYAKFAEQFNPVKFDADAWVRMARDAGMKYIVFTAKHHDGFAMFKTNASVYNIVDATPYHRDPLKDIAAACQKYGIKLGLYYSQAQDWHHAGGAIWAESWDTSQQGDMDVYLESIAYLQVKELLTNYGPIAVLWWDTPHNMTPERGALLAPLLKLQPGIITNNRLAEGFLGDTETPEQKVPATGYPRDWEACMTMNNTWGFKSYDHDWKSPERLVRTLIDVTSKGGNFLLNVGPTAEGEIPTPSIDRLRVMGDWLRRNGESIYGTTASPFKQLAWGRATQKPGKLYLHVFTWPQDGHLVVPMKSRVKAAYLLSAVEHPLKFTSETTGIDLELSSTAPDPISSVVVLDLEGPIEALPPPATKPSADGCYQLTCDAADLVGPGIRVDGHLAFNLAEWRSTSAYAKWQIAVDDSGEYDVVIVAQVPAEEAGSEYFVSIGDQRMIARTTSTGSAFSEATIGRVQLSPGDRFDVVIQPTKIANREFMKLRTILLCRVKTPKGK